MQHTGASAIRCVRQAEHTIMPTHPAGNCSVVLLPRPRRHVKPGLSQAIVLSLTITSNTNSALRTSRLRPATPCPGAAQPPPSRPAGQYAPAGILCRRERPAGRAAQTLHLSPLHKGTLWTPAHRCTNTPPRSRAVPIPLSTLEPGAASAVGRRARRRRCVHRGCRSW